MSSNGLTYKQKKFIDEYLKCFNATKAAKLAGYKGNGNTLRAVGAENLAKPSIKAEVEVHFKANAMSRDETISRIAEHARADYKSYLTEDGVDLSRLLADDKGHLVKGIKPSKYGQVVEFYDGQSALNIIAKHHGLLSDKLEIKLENELDSALDLLEKNLDKETFERVLTVLTKAG